MAATYSTLVANRLGGWRTVLRPTKGSQRTDRVTARSFRTPHEAVSHAHNTYGTLVLISSESLQQVRPPVSPSPPSAA